MRDRTLAAGVVGAALLLCAPHAEAEAPALAIGEGAAVPSDASPTTEAAGPSELRDSDELDWQNDKTWQVRGSLEYHHLVRQNDLAPSRLETSTGEGDAANRNLLYYVFSGQWEPTAYDRWVAQWGIYQRFLADAGETGVRGDDGILAYTRSIPLPERVMLRIQPRVDLGFSYDSIKHTGLIAAPRLGISVERRFGPLELYALMYGYVYLERYTSASGGEPNPTASLASVWQASLRVPRVSALEAGVAAYAAVTWYHEVHDDGSNAVIVQEGSTSDPLTASQPFSNTFGGEVFVRYTLPAGPLASQMLVAYANGDPTIGYQALRHDGVGRFNLFYRHVSELYAALTLRY